MAIEQWGWGRGSTTPTVTPEIGFYDLISTTPPSLTKTIIMNSSVLLCYSDKYGTLRVCAMTRTFL